MTAEGFYHCSVKPVGRANGRSIVAAAAYRSGQRLEDERTGEVFDFRARGGVLENFIVARDGAPDWALDHGRQRLWNEAERAEGRVNGRLATELELALPCELTDVQRRDLVTGFVRGIVEQHGVAADVAIHAPGKGGDHRNHHAHVLITHRELGPEGFGEIANRRTVMKKVKGEQKPVEIAGIAATPADIKALRKAWELDVNRAYERAGLDTRVDHRSHEDRGIDRTPTKHVGPTAMAMEREGVQSDRGDANREITQRNAERAQIIRLEAVEAAIKSEIVWNREAAREAEPPIVQAFDAAARRTTEPAAPIFDRDQAEREWLEKLQAAAVAKDGAPPAQEPRQTPEAEAGTEAPASPRAPSRAPETEARAVEEAPAADSGAQPADRAASGILGHLAKVAEILGGLLFGSLISEPKLTAAQTHERKQAAGNVETLHAEAVARHTAEVEAERAERISRADSEQQAPLAAPGYFRTVTRPADPAERRRQEQQHERERER